MSRFKKPILIIFITIASIMLLAIITSLVFGPKIKGLVIDQMNARLAAPVQVEDINFSLLRKFPLASIDFKGVKIKGAKTFDGNQDLLQAEHLFFMFSWFDLFSDEIHLKKIEVQDAFLNIYTDKNALNNFDIFKKDSSKKSKLNLKLESVLFDNVETTYISIPGKRNYNAAILNGEFSGNFTDEIYEMKMNSDLFVRQFKMEGTNYLDHKSTSLQLAITINNKDGLYDIHASTLKVEELSFDVFGNIKDEVEGVNMDLNISSKEAGLKELLSFIPGLFTDKLSKYRYDGDIYFNLKISGKSSKKTTPKISATFGTENATLKPKDSDYTLKNIRFKGDYTSSISMSKPYALLRLNNLSASLEGQPFNANLEVEDFNNPLIHLRAKSKINLEVLRGFFMPDTVESMSGNVVMDATITGRTNDKTSWLSDGDFILQNVSFKLKEKPVAFTDFNGTFSLAGNRLTLTNIRGNAAGSDFSANGSFDNIYSFILSDNEVLNGKITLSSRNLDLNELLEDKKKSTETDTLYRLDFNKRLSVSMNVNVGILTFRKFQAWQMNGNIELHNKILTTSNLNFKACEGSIKLEGSINAQDNDSILIAYDANIKKIDINQLFSQMGNFGQSVLIDKNVKGNVTADVQFASVWSKSLHCNLDKIYAKGNLTIENGELINFDPLLALSKYVKGADLKQIKFNTLKNQIEIKNQTIYIPTMEIKTNAMDLIASGTHKFNNIIDYHLQLYLSQILGKKVKEMNTEFGTIQDDGLGKTRIFLTMAGPASNPKITYDRTGIEQKIKTDLIQEKQNLKNILREEFGWFKKDSTKARQDQPNTPNNNKKEELQIEYDN